MRLTTKFSAFVTLLTSLTIFVTLIGASLSFYNGIQLKMANRVQALATVLDNRLVSMSFEQIEPQMDELMTPVDAIRIDFKLNGNVLYSHSRTDNYRPLGSSNQFRDIMVPSLKRSRRWSPQLPALSAACLVICRYSASLMENST